MSLSEHALTTLKTLKSELLIPEAESSHDATLIRIINGASDAIRRYCRRDFCRATVTERVRGSGRQTLLLSRTPIVDIESVLMDDQAVMSYEVQAGPGMLINTYGAWPENATITIAYTAGYVTPKQAADSSDTLVRDLPHDVEEACIITAVTRYQYLGQPADAQILQLEQIRVHFVEGGRSGIPQAAQALLEPYVRWA